MTDKTIRKTRVKSTHPKQQGWFQTIEYGEGGRGNTNKDKFENKTAKVKPGSTTIRFVKS